MTVFDVPPRVHRSQAGPPARRGMCSPASAWPKCDGDHGSGIVQGHAHLLPSPGLFLPFLDLFLSGMDCETELALGSLFDDDDIPAAYSSATAARTLGLFLLCETSLPDLLPAAATLRNALSSKTQDWAAVATESGHRQRICSTSERNLKFSSSQ